MTGISLKREAKRPPSFHNDGKDIKGKDPSPGQERGSPSGNARKTTGTASGQASGAARRRARTRRACAARRRAVTEPIVFGGCSVDSGWGLAGMAVGIHARGWDKGAGRIGLTFQLSPLCHRVPLARHVPSEPHCPPPCGYTAGPQPPKHKAGAGWSSAHFYGPALFPQRFQ